jgi:RND superfamily putative drug exporter
MLDRIARWAYRRRWWMLAIWIVALAGFLVLGATAGGKYAEDFSLPGTESQHGFDLLKQQFPSQSGDQAQIVFKADAGVTDPAVQETMQGLFDSIAKLPLVDDVQSPYAQGGPPAVSRDGKIGYATVQFAVAAPKVPKAEVTQMEDLGQAAESSGLEIRFGGPVISQSEFAPPGNAEAVAGLAAIIILLITFGSVLAMGLPLLMAAFGIGIALPLILLFARFLSVPNFTPQLASMIGIGVGIDYALFIVTRYRQGLDEGRDPEDAVVRAMTTSGRAVVFAGIIVVISFLGILLMQFKFVQGIAVGGAATVFVTMLAAITLLPAVLGFVGHNIDKWHIPRLRRSEAQHGQTFWYRWSRIIQRRPWPAGLIGLAVLLVLTIPLFKMRLGFADAGNNPKTSQSRQAYDLLTAGFGPGFNGPLFLVAETGGPQGMATLQSLSQGLATTPGVVAATPPIPNQSGNTAIITVIPTTSPQDAATSDLVHQLRDRTIPQATTGTNVHVFVSGLTAISIDFSQKNAQRLPVLIAVVIGLSFILLMGVFRSLLVPVKAAIMNLLSIGAAYGVLVAVFQWGWLKGVVGIDKAGPIEAWAPMMLFTILFGLSMDYEIFLLSRIREEYLRSHDNNTAVANGVAATGRVITAAAAIMVAVFLSFVIGFPLRQIKLFGLGLAAAVLVDATIVRMVLVPATMELLGEANWWYPRWLSRVTPRIGIEESHEAITPRAPLEPEPARD